MFHFPVGHPNTNGYQWTESRESACKTCTKIEFCKTRHVRGEHQGAQLAAGREQLESVTVCHALREGLRFFATAGCRTFVPHRTEYACPARAGRRRSKPAQALSPLPVAISRDDGRCAAQLLYNGKLTCDEFSSDKNTCLSYFIHVDVTPTPAWSTTAYVRNPSTAPRRAL
jgi:hypothetical protein